MIITYEQVFGVPLGGELREGQGVNDVACPAVKSLRKQLTAFPFFAGGKVQGMGALLKNGTMHEFNRHHAGLAVDIMLNEKSDSEVTLGHHLVKLFWDQASVMLWRGMIYQDVTLDLVGGTRRAAPWTGGGHWDHIHIDWHNPGNVQWQTGITSVPYRRASGDVVQIPAVEGNRIAEAITQTTEALTLFETNATLQKELASLLDRSAKGALAKLDLGSAFGLSGLAAPVAGHEVVGTWNVTIGNWSGIFVFDARGGVSWADDERSPKHPGSWSASGWELQWKFKDVGDFRTFVVALPLSLSSTKGRILPAGQGFFEMSRSK